jgi:hypothetical protein
MPTFKQWEVHTEGMALYSHRLNQVQTKLRTFRFRVAAAYVLLLVGSLAALGVFVFGQVSEDIRRSKENDLVAQAEMLSNLFVPLMEQGTAMTELDRLAKQLGKDTDTRFDHSPR